MKKTILQGSIFALLWLGVASEGHWAGWQGSARSQGTVLEVAVPDKATVTRKQGASLTGQLTAFNQTSLTLSAEGYSEKVPLTGMSAWLTRMVTDWPTAALPSIETSSRAPPRPAE